MRRFVRKAFAGFMAAALFMGSLICTVPQRVYGAEQAGTAATQQPFRVLTAEEMVAEMGAGWNLGNTMDGHTGFTPSETIWQHVETTKQIIKTVHDQGFNTVRIPVTWGTMIDDENGYAINEKWMSRVQDIVDYCIEQDMYVIVNVHHDGAEQTGWLRIAAEDFDAVKEKYEAVWVQIAERFKDYDEHLIFESMNEVTGTNDKIQQDVDRIMELNQIFVDIVRRSGSNNAQRWLSVPARYTNIGISTSDKYGFHMPEDWVEDRLFLSVHYYDWSFGLNETMADNSRVWTEAKTKELAEEFALLKKFTDQGIPVIVGEYGAIDKRNEEQRAYHYEVVNRLAKENGLMVTCYWDNGEYDLNKEPSDYCFTLIDRETCTAVYPGLIAAILRGTFLDGPKDCSDLGTEAAVRPMEDFELSESEVQLEIGAMYRVEVAASTPEDNNDIVLWRTENPNVATVYNGNIRARGIGTTAVTAYTQSGSVEKTLIVTVAAEECDIPCTGLVLPEEIKLTVDKYTFLETQILPEDTDAYLTYYSTNEEVATVSKTGKILAKSEGVAYIVVTASSGLAKTVRVVVTGAGQASEIELALNVYYNDNDISFFNNEYGEAITVVGEGTYTVSFDCGTDLSEAAVKAGVKGLNNLTAIYIKDQAVTLGDAKKTNLESCDIFYDRIVVDGVELTVNMTEPKSALKSSGVFDTNDPFNSWDGSMVEEVTVSNHVLNISAVENPQRVEVTFTLSNMVFPAGEEEGSERTALESIELEVADRGDGTYLATARVLPAEAEEKIFITVSDASVLAGNGIFTGPDESGSVSAVLTGLTAGDVVVTAVSESGLTAEAALAVENTVALNILARAVGDIVYAAPVEKEEETGEPETEESTTEAETEKQPEPTAQGEGESDKAADTGTAEEDEQDIPVQASAKKGVSVTTAVIIIAVAVAAAVVVVLLALRPKKAPKEEAKASGQEKTGGEDQSKTEK